MMQTYPLNVIVSNNHQLNQTYNKDINSGYLLSECLPTNEVHKLIDAGALLKTLVFLEEENQNLLASIQSTLPHDAEMPYTHIYDPNGAALSDSVKALQKLVGPPRHYAGIAAVGAG